MTEGLLMLYCWHREPEIVPLLAAPGYDASDYVHAAISPQQQLSNLQDRDTAFRSVAAAFTRMRRHRQAQNSLDLYKRAQTNSDSLSPADLAKADDMERLRG